MASTKCAFPSCERDVLGIAKIVSLSENESEILKLRYGSDMKFLCDPHYSEQFKKYNSWHSRKCSDPCVTHKKPRKRVIFFKEIADMLRNKGTRAIAVRHVLNKKKLKSSFSSIFDHHGGDGFT